MKLLKSEQASYTIIAALRIVVTCERIIRKTNEWTFFSQEKAVQLFRRPPRVFIRGDGHSAQSTAVSTRRFLLILSRSTLSLSLKKGDGYA